MPPARYRFDRFDLDPANRQISCDGERLEISARYLDALVLLVREHGNLVSKDRFLSEVWRGVPVTDEALTQCIRTLRRQLGDDASAPRFIETVPKHGYRFVAPVEPLLGPGRARAEAISGPDLARRELIRAGLAGTLGGSAAGLVGGLFYGLGARPLALGVGSVSVLLVLLAVTMLLASIGAAGVSFGIAAGARVARQAWYGPVIGGALGGMLVGGLVRLLGLDALALLLGARLADMTGGVEGFALGAAVGVGAWLAQPPAAGLRRAATLAGLCGAVAGGLIPLLGGRMMGGSLDGLVRGVPGSRLSLDPIARLFGEPAFGPVSHVATGVLEGALFGGCVVGAMILAQRLERGA